MSTAHTWLEVLIALAVFTGVAMLTFGTSRRPIIRGFGLLVAANIASAIQAGHDGRTIALVLSIGLVLLCLCGMWLWIVRPYPQDGESGAKP